MFEEVRSAVATLERVMRTFEPRTVDGSDAVTLVDLFARIEHLGAAGKALAATRVDETSAYRASGHRSAGQLLADRSGATVGAAESLLRAVKRLDEQPAVANAFRAGELSETATREISYAASKNPEAQNDLVRYARRKRPMKGLKERCARVVAASIDDDREWDRQLHETREGRMFDDRGHLRLDVRFSPDHAPGVYAAVEAETDLVFREARAAGRRELRAAYMADAVARLILGGPSKPIDARLDVAEAALERGHVAEGEKFEIPGLALGRAQPAWCGGGVDPDDPRRRNRAGGGRDSGRRPDRAKRGSRGSATGRRPTEWGRRRRHHTPVHQPR